MRSLLTNGWYCDVCLVNELHREKGAGDRLGSWPILGSGAS